MDVLTILLGVAALVGLFLGGLMRWGGHDRFFAVGRVEALFFPCGGLLVLAAGLVLERLRWERHAGLSVPFDERFRWLDAPAAEDAHEALVAPRAPGWVRALRPTAYALVGLAVTVWSVGTGTAGNAFSLILLGGYVLPGIVALVRRAYGGVPRRRDPGDPWPDASRRG